jgi:hypothetical protein
LEGVKRVKKSLFALLALGFLLGGLFAVGCIGHLSRPPGDIGPSKVM